MKGKTSTAKAVVSMKPLITMMWHPSTSYWSQLGSQEKRGKVASGNASVAESSVCGLLADCLKPTLIRIVGDFCRIHAGEHQIQPQSEKFLKIFDFGYIHEVQLTINFNPSPLRSSERWNAFR